MTHNVLRNGIVWLAAGFLCGSLSSLLDHVAGAAQAVNWARGFLDGFACVAFATAIYLLVRQAQHASDKERKA